MRLLVAGRRAEAVARAAGAFADDLGIETAASKAAAVTLLERARFDLVLACEKLDDGSGLEVLSHVAVNSPNTLRIFAARPSTLDLLKVELGFFGLFRTLPYPINFRNVWSAIELARPRRPAATTRIPESEAFERARARRNEAKRRGELSVINGPLAQLAQPVPTRRPTLHSGLTPGRWKRAAGLVAAGTAAFLAVFMMRSFKPIAPPALTLVAASGRPVSDKALPWLQWQAPRPQPTPTTFIPRGTVAPATTDMEVEAQAEAEAEAEFEQSGSQTGYPSPLPTPPSGPAVPPPYAAAVMSNEQ